MLDSILEDSQDRPLANGRLTGPAVDQFILFFSVLSYSPWWAQGRTKSIDVDVLSQPFSINSTITSRKECVQSLHQKTVSNQEHQYLKPPYTQRTTVQTISSLYSSCHLFSALQCLIYNPSPPIQYINQQ